MAATSHEDFITKVGKTLDQHFEGFKRELIDLYRDLSASATTSAAVPPASPLEDAPFLSVVDALHALAPSAPEKLRSQLKSKLYGAEDLHALAGGFVTALRKTTSRTEIVKFEVSDRRRGTSVPVMLPAISHAFMEKDIDKAARELKALRKGIVTIPPEA